MRRVACEKSFEEADSGRSVGKVCLKKRLGVAEHLALIRHTVTRISHPSQAFSADGRAKKTSVGLCGSRFWGNGLWRRK